MRRAPRPLLQSPSAALAVSVDHLIGLCLLHESDPFFVQIGAFDGRTDDALYPYVSRYRWRGIVVEPQPRYFAALRETYADHPQLDLRNVAITDQHETRSIYAVDVDAPGLPAWAPQIAGFDRDRIVNTTFPYIEHSVECITITELLDGVERVDILQIDVEGYDAVLIGAFPFESLLPAVVRFENVCLSRAAHEGAIQRLINHGYSVAVAGPDTIGWRPTS